MSRRITFPFCVEIQPYYNVYARKIMPAFSTYGEVVICSSYSRSCIFRLPPVECLAIIDLAFCRQLRSSGHLN